MTAEKDKMKESFMRTFLRGQRVMNQKATAVMATIAQANMDMILAAGLNKLPANKVAGDGEEDQDTQGTV